MGDFTFNFNQFPVLKKALRHNNKKYFTKYRYAFYLSYATLVTYVPVFGAEKFQFPCGVISEGF